ncbi:putative membrane-anchored protein [Natronocella acetinitrilica]|uniref:Membrane-anchored protein n=1 Tax=Natronocella acetinitrilica TaxID=414046 RepID=A0AAE3G2Q9_9GAMM|nr:DUF4407 domain-containing protein [Natronocella acetinitrilica]MCP1674755.1 putative membrane-anchored protein [Natronocella acetinitrilica]
MQRRNERLVALFLVGAVLLNYPLLSLFATDGMVFGLPVLVVYLFVIWAVIIFCTWLVLRPKKDDRDRGQRNAP